MGVDAFRDTRRIIFSLEMQSEMTLYTFRIYIHAVDCDFFMPNRSLYALNLMEI
jgi:hypothetical protein